MLNAKKSEKDTKLKWKKKSNPDWQSLEAYIIVNGKNKDVCVSVCLIDEIPKVAWRNKNFHSEY